MGKVIFWLVVIFVALFVARLVNVGKAKARHRARSSAATPPATMVRCVECGVFLPKSDARPVPNGFHCAQVNCAQHRAREG